MASTAITIQRQRSVRDDGWQAIAACYGEDQSLFFAPDYFEVGGAKNAREAKAKLICRACPVREECLAYAMAIEEEHGVWGGLNERERRRLRARMIRAEAEAAEFGTAASA